jgi:hypothetical protein
VQARRVARELDAREPVGGFGAGVLPDVIEATGRRAGHVRDGVEAIPRLHVLFFAPAASA